MNNSHKVKNARGEHKSSMSIRPRGVITENGEPSMTDQSFAKDCDLKVIIGKFTRGSLTPDQVYRAGQYGDFIDAPDFIQSQQIIAETTQHFESLPAEIRDAMDNDVATYLDFVHNPENKEAMEELGLNTDHFAQTNTEVLVEPQNAPESQISEPQGDAHRQTDIED